MPKFDTLVLGIVPLWAVGLAALYYFFVHKKKAV